MKKLLSTIFVLVLFFSACTRKTNNTYLQAARTAVDNFNAVVEILDGRILEFQTDPSVLQDSTWIADSLQVLADLKTAGDAFGTLPEPSTDLANLDVLLVTAATQTDQYVEAMNTAINNKDVNAVNSAKSLREAIGDTINDAQNELIRFLS